MLTYLLVAGWLGRRLDLDGRVRPVAGVMLLVLALLPVPPGSRDAWPVVRTTLNAVASGPAVVWGLLHGGRPGWRGGLLMVTGMRSGTGPRKEVMVGSVLLTRHPRRQLRAPLVQHEVRHADQWAILGPVLMPPAYWLAEAGGDLLTDCGDGGNVFEIGAGLQAGGYNRMPEIRCAGLLSRPRHPDGVPPPRWALDRAFPPALPVSRSSGSPRRRRRYCLDGRSPPPGRHLPVRLCHRLPARMVAGTRWAGPGGGRGERGRTVAVGRGDLACARRARPGGPVAAASLAGRGAGGGGPVVRLRPRDHLAPGR